jgi:hypothetical protein
MTKGYKSGLTGVSGFSYDTPYINNAPVQTDDQDTGINPANLPPNSIVFTTVVFTVNSNANQYAIAISTDNQLVQALPDLRQLRSAEPVTGGGDVAIASWWDGTTGTYHYSLDVDGGGKKLNSVSITVRSLA